MFVLIVQPSLGSLMSDREVLMSKVSMNRFDRAIKIGDRHAVVTQTGCARLELLCRPSVSPNWRVKSQITRDRLQRSILFACD